MLNNQNYSCFRNCFSVIFCYYSIEISITSSTTTETSTISKDGNEVLPTAFPLKKEIKFPFDFSKILEKLKEFQKVHTIDEKGRWGFN